MWSPELKTGNDLIDRQHEKLLKMVEKALAIIVSATHSEQVTDIFFEVMDYSKFHFETEESLMELIDYDDSKRHKKQHQQFISRLKQAWENFDPDDAKGKASTTHLLRRWYINHLKKEDKRLVLETMSLSPQILDLALGEYSLREETGNYHAALNSFSETKNSDFAEEDDLPWEE